MNKIIWKDIDNFIGLYKINNLGDIFSIKKNKILKIDNSIGYSRITLHKHGKSKKFLVHRLLAIAFILNNENKKCINHKDGNKLNNRLDNLEWCTYTENNQHAIDVGLRAVKLGEESPHHKLNKKTVIEIRHQLDKGLSQRKIAKLFNISQSAVQMINVKKTWKHLL